MAVLLEHLRQQFDQQRFAFQRHDRLGDTLMGIQQAPGEVRIIRHRLAKQVHMLAAVATLQDRVIQPVRIDIEHPVDPAGLVHRHAIVDFPGTQGHHRPGPAEVMDTAVIELFHALGDHPEGIAVMGVPAEMLLAIARAEQLAAPFGNAQEAGEILLWCVHGLSSFVQSWSGAGLLGSAFPSKPASDATTWTIEKPFSNSPSAA